MLLEDEADDDSTTALMFLAFLGDDGIITATIKMIIKHYGMSSSVPRAATKSTSINVSTNRTGILCEPADTTEPGAASTGD